VIRVYLLLTMLMLAACRTGPGDVPTPSAPATPSAAPTFSSPAAIGLCAVLSAEAVSSIAGKTALVDPTSSNAETCTYTVGESNSIGATFVVAIRTEEGFEDLAAVRQTFAGGQDIGAVGDDAYWSPQVHVLWFVTHGALYAVQLLNFPGQPEEALALARAIADRALASL
jgi:hypothetical protein